MLQTLEAEVGAIKRPPGEPDPKSPPESHTPVPFVVTFFQHPIVVEELVTRKILWGLLGTKTEPVFIEIEGYLLVPEIRQALTAIIGFYFGQATVKR